MVYVKFKEKFKGKMLSGTFLKKFRSENQAIKELGVWNGLKRSDKIVIKGVYNKRPVGFRKTKYAGILKEK